MIPPSPPIGSENELQLFELLSVVSGTEHWIALHQLDLSAHVSQASGEADLIVMIPGEGVVFLEVKGHVRLENGQWFFGSDPNPKRSPFDQAKGAMYSVLRWLREHRGDVGPVPMFWGAVFTKTVWSAAIPDAFPDQIIDSASVDSRNPELLRDSLLLLARAGRERLASLPSPVTFADGEPTDERLALLASALRPTVHPPVALVNTIWSRVSRYTEEQLVALDECTSNRQVIFRGLAGTGKTVLAAELASREQALGRATLFVCFTELVREKLLASAGARGEVVIRGVIQLALDLIGVVAGQSVRQEWRAALDRDTHTFNDLVRTANDLAADLPEDRKYDTLIVDEAQDVLSKPLLSILDSWVKGGLAHGRWILFADPMQAIFLGREVDLELFERTHPSAKVRYLFANCRNTEAIAMFANDLASLVDPFWYDRLLVKHRSEPAHPVPSITSYSDANDQDTLVMKHLFTLLDAGIPPGEIVVLSASRQSSCASRIRAQGMERLLVPYRLDVQDRIRFDTIHHFKGMESTAVVLTDLDELSDAGGRFNRRELLYVAVTRAVFRLDCFASCDCVERLRLGEGDEAHV